MSYGSLVLVPSRPPSSNWKRPGTHIWRHFQKRHTYYIKTRNLISSTFLTIPTLGCLSRPGWDLPSPSPEEPETGTTDHNSLPLRGDIEVLTLCPVVRSQLGKSLGIGTLLRPRWGVHWVFFYNSVLYLHSRDYKKILWVKLRNNLSYMHFVYCNKSNLKKQCFWKFVWVFSS